LATGAAAIAAIATLNAQARGRTDGTTSAQEGKSNAPHAIPLELPLPVMNFLVKEATRMLLCE
jgi:hypothetical protein